MFVDITKDGTCFAWPTCVFPTKSLRGVLLEGELCCFLPLWNPMCSMCYFARGSSARAPRGSAGLRGVLRGASAGVRGGPRGGQNSVIFANLYNQTRFPFTCAFFQLFLLRLPFGCIFLSVSASIQHKCFESSLVCVLSNRFSLSAS